MEGRNKRYIELKTKTERRRQVTNRIRYTGLFLFSVYFYIRLTNGSIKQKSKTKIKDKRIDVIIIRSKTENTTKPKGLRYIVHGPRSTVHGPRFRECRPPLRPPLGFHQPKQRVIFHSCAAPIANNVAPPGPEKATVRDNSLLQWDAGLTG